MKKKTVKVSIAPAEAPLYSLSLVMGNEKYEGKGKTMLEALMSLPRPTKILLKGILTIRKGEQINERLLQPMKVKRLFMPVARFYQSKYLEFGMK